MVETMAMRTLGIDRFSGRTKKAEESQLISEIAEELKKTASDLYFAHKMSRARMVAAVHLSFQPCDIFIVIPVCGVAFDGGPTDEIPLGDALLGRDPRRVC
jgi:hypothetical protein